MANWAMVCVCVNISHTLRCSSFIRQVNDRLNIKNINTTIDINKSGGDRKHRIAVFSSMKLYLHSIFQRFECFHYTVALTVIHVRQFSGSLYCKQIIFDIIYPITTSPHHISPNILNTHPSLFAVALMP